MRLQNFPYCFFLRVNNKRVPNTWIGWFVFTNIALVLLLFLPIRLRAALRLAPAGGRGRITVRFALLTISLRYRIHLLSQPYLSVSRLTANGGLKRVLPNRKPKTRLQKSLDRKMTFSNVAARVRINRFTLKLRLGLGDAAATALLAGTVQSVLLQAAAAVPFTLPEDTAISALPDFDRMRCNLEGECMLSTSIAKIIPIFLQRKGK